MCSVANHNEVSALLNDKLFLRVFRDVLDKVWFLD